MHRLTLHHTASHRTVLQRSVPHRTATDRTAPRRHKPLGTPTPCHATNDAHTFFQELKQLKQKLHDSGDQHKVSSMVAASAEARLATMHAERDNAKRSDRDENGDGAERLELRRHLKDRTAQLMLLTQRYDHLNARFETVRDNHEKVCCSRPASLIVLFPSAVAHALVPPRCSTLTFPGAGPDE